MILDVSPYQRKKPKSSSSEPEALTTLLAKGSLEMKEEPYEEVDEDDILAVVSKFLLNFNYLILNLQCQISQIVYAIK